MEKYWGYHLILDCAGLDEVKMTDADNVRAFAKQLVADIDMVAYGEPQVHNFGSGNKAGFTLVQLIETSNICAHFANEDRTMYLDVFSCKTFDRAVVVELVKEFFGATHIKETYLLRDAKV